MKARDRIGSLMKKYYEDALKVKQQGGKVGWVTSNFPQEIIQTMELCVIYPENHSATAAVKGEDTDCCRKAEAAGFSNDICSYAKVNIGYCLEHTLISEQIPEPDYLLCCSNICHQLMKWYKYLEQKFQIPLILIDVPYNTDYETDEIRLNYIKKQFQEAISSLEIITGKKFDNNKFQEVMRISNQAGRLWNRISDLLIEDKTALKGTDLFNYMGLVVCQRGRKETVEALQLLYNELSDKNDEYKNRDRVKWKYRILYEGICCWPGLMKLSISFARYGINMVGAVYTNAYGIEYDSFDGMIKAYTHVPNAVSIERARDMRINEIKKKNCGGMLVHMSRSCKIWSGIMYEMIRQIQEAVVIPVITFDGDQADKQCFSEAQYDTRLQGFYELMEDEI